MVTTFPRCSYLFSVARCTPRRGEPITAAPSGAGVANWSVPSARADPCMWFFRGPRDHGPCASMGEPCATYCDKWRVASAFASTTSPTSTRIFTSSCTRAAVTRFRDFCDRSQASLRGGSLGREGAGPPAPSSAVWHGRASSDGVETTPAFVTTSFGIKSRVQRARASGARSSEALLERAAIRGRQHCHGRLHTKERADTLVADCERDVKTLELSAPSGLTSPAEPRFWLLADRPETVFFLGRWRTTSCSVSVPKRRCMRPSTATKMAMELLQGAAPRRFPYRKKRRGRHSSFVEPRVLFSGPPVFRLSHSC